MTLYDPEAEMTVAACAVATPHGALLAHSRLDPEDFHDPVLRDLFIVAPSLPLPRATDAGPESARIHAAAKACRVKLAQVEQLCAERPVMDDSGGHFAKRVSRTALHRDASQRLFNVVDQLSQGIPLDADEQVEAALALLRGAA